MIALQAIPEADFRLRVVCVDDNADLVQMLQVMLHHQVDMDCVDVFTDPRPMLAYLDHTRPEKLPDVIVMDWTMPGVNAPKLIAEIVRRWPAVRVLVFSAYGDSIVDAAVEAGCWGVIGKQAGMNRLAEGIRKVAHGEAAFG